MYCKSMELLIDIVRGCCNKVVNVLENLSGKLCNGLLLDDTKGEIFEKIVFIFFFNLL